MEPGGYSLGYSRLKGAKGEMTEMKRLSINPQIKSAHCRYRDQTIGRIRVPIWFALLNEGKLYAGWVTKKIVFFPWNSH